jgi:hypothetical protein
MAATEIAWKMKIYTPQRSTSKSRSCYMLGKPGEMWSVVNLGDPAKTTSRNIRIQQAVRLRRYSPTRLFAAFTHRHGPYGWPIFSVFDKIMIPERSLIVTTGTCRGLAVAGNSHSPSELLICRLFPSKHAFGSTSTLSNYFFFEILYNIGRLDQLPDIPY